MRYLSLGAAILGKQNSVRGREMRERQQTHPPYGIAKQTTASQENAIGSWLTHDLSEEKGVKLTW